MISHVPSLICHVQEKWKLSFLIKKKPQFHVMSKCRGQTRISSQFCFFKVVCNGNCGWFLGPGLPHPYTPAMWVGADRSWAQHLEGHRLATPILWMTKSPKALLSSTSPHSLPRLKDCSQQGAHVSWLIPYSHNSWFCLKEIKREIKMDLSFLGCWHLCQILCLHIVVLRHPDSCILFWLCWRG